MNYCDSRVGFPGVCEAVEQTVGQVVEDKDNHQDSQIGEKHLKHQVNVIVLSNDGLGKEKNLVNYCGNLSARFNCQL